MQIGKYGRHVNMHDALSASGTVETGKLARKGAGMDSYLTKMGDRFGSLASVALAGANRLGGKS